MTYCVLSLSGHIRLSGMALVKGELLYAAGTARNGGIKSMQKAWHPHSHSTGSRKMIPSVVPRH